jgi:hypothetical protein
MQSSLVLENSGQHKPIVLRVDDELREVHESPFGGAGWVLLMDR